MARNLELLKKSLSPDDTAGVKDAAGHPIRYTRMPDGALFPPFYKENINNVQTTRLRPDDVIVCGFPKTGCHWTMEIITMIITGKAEYSKVGKLEAFLELSPVELVESLPSPRLLNTHCPFPMLPTELKTLKTKIVLTCRNPKDTAVSLFNFIRQLNHIYNYEGKFEDWLPLWLDGINAYGHFVDYHLKWDQVIRENPDHPILVVSYEDMIEDLQGNVKKIAQFLEKPITDELVSEISSSCTFNCMVENVENVVLKQVLRKGQVGGWKDWLTVSASEQMDKWQPQLDKTVFKFKYTL